MRSWSALDAALLLIVVTLCAVTLILAFSVALR